MTKHIKLRIERILKCADKKYVNDVIDSIVDSLHDFPNTVERIGLERDNDTFIVKFDLKVSKTGDHLLILLEEWLSCILQTEPNINVSIFSHEETDNYEIENNLIAHLKQ